MITIAKAMLVLAVVIFGSSEQATKKAQESTGSKWTDGKVDARFNKGYVDDNNNLVLSWVVKNRSGRDIEINFKSFPQEPARVFLKIKNNQSAIRVKPESSFVYFLDDMIPEDLPLTFRMLFPVPPSGLFEKKPTYQEILYKHLGNVESIIVYVPGPRLKITFPMP